jgi:hypothetical protein
MQHTLQKLAEVRPNRTSTSTSTTAPPPYTLSVHRPTGVSVMSLDQSDPLYEEEPMSPITIHIDNSITVTGNNNIIVLSSSGPSSSTTSRGPEDRNSSRLSSLAAIIIAALNRAHALRDELGVPRPVNININSAIRVDGNNNTIPQAVIPKPKPDVVNVGVGEDIVQKRRASSVSAPIHISISLRILSYH